MVETSTETVVETIPPAQPAPARPWHRQITLAMSGFMLSVTLALINAFYAIRGSDVVVQPPEQVILYRDGEGSKAVLTFAMRLAMINAADAGHGDVLMDASIEPIADGPSFRYAAEVQPVFTSDPEAASKCALGARCIVLPGLMAIENGDEIIDIPGGAVRAKYLSFPAAEWNCDGGERACAGFANFPSALRALSGRPLKVSVRVRFNSDGKRDLTCATRPVDADYLRTRGWTTMSCSAAKVSGGPLL